jgi:arylformamidase
MKIGRLVDLTLKLRPGDEKSELHIKTNFVEELLPKYKREKDQWYILQIVTFLDHIGTHVEAPFHYVKDGKDVSEIPLERLVREAVILDFTQKKPNEMISLAEISKSNNDIRQGDIVLIRTGRDKYVNRFTEYERPFISTDAIKWLVEEKKISCLGIDCSGMEDKKTSHYTQPNHQILLENEIPIIENLANLDKLKKKRVLLFVLPLKIEGLASCPVRVIAIEEDAIEGAQSK